MHPVINLLTVVYISSEYIDRIYFCYDFSGSSLPSTWSLHISSETSIKDYPDVKFLLTILFLNQVS